MQINITKTDKTITLIATLTVQDKKIFIPYYIDTDKSIKEFLSTKKYLEIKKT